MANNKCNLIELELGLETTLFNIYDNGNIYMDGDPYNSFSEQLRTEIDTAFKVEGGEETQSEYLPHIACFTLHGLGIETIICFTGQNFLKLESLTYLRLNSCWDLPMALKKFRILQLPALRSFHIRYEKVDHRFFYHLGKFLLSLPGLNDLSLLLEGKIHPRGLKNILEVHGESLQTLVFDYLRAVRTSSKESPTLCAESITFSILKHCPHLVELGLPIPWGNLEPSGHHRSEVLVNLMNAIALKSDFDNSS